MLLIDGSGNTTTHTVIIQRGHLLQNAQEQAHKPWLIERTPAPVAQHVCSRVPWVVSGWLNGANCDDKMKEMTVICFL